MYELIGCPSHCGVPGKGDGLTGGIRALNQLLSDCRIREIPERILPEADLPNLKCLNSVVATNRAIAAAVAEIKGRGNTPLFFGGDHAAAIGSVSGDAADEERLGLIWVDAHSDINTDETTTTGNIHGMPVAALLGLGREELRTIHGDRPKILPQDVVLFGLRDVDPPEAEIIRQQNIKCFYFSEIEERGLDVCLREAREYLAGVDRLHISFDLDVMDPQRIKGVSVPVEGGFSDQEVFRVFHGLLTSFDVSAIDIVEYNPTKDADGQTGRFVAELVRRITSGPLV